jgi:hypothetical protein
MLHVDEGQLHAYLDGELASFGAAEARDVEAHLATCPVCRIRLEEARWIRDRANAILRHSGPAELPAPPFESIASRSPGGPARDARRWRLRSGATAAWAASIILALGLGWFSREMTRSGEQMAAVSESAHPATSGETAVTQDAHLRQVAPLPAQSEVQARRAPADATRMRSAVGKATAALPRSRIAAAAPAPAAKDAVAGEMGVQADTVAIASGRVTTEAGVPIANAQVHLGSGTGTITAPDGTYSLTIPASRLPESAELTITAQVIGMNPEAHRLTLKPGETAVQDFQLEPAALALDALVVTSQGTRSAGGKEPRKAASAAAAPGPPVSAESRWVPVDRAEAERRLGGPILTVADLPIMDIAVGTADGEPTVRTRQRTGDGKTLELFQRVASPTAGDKRQVRSVETAESAEPTQDRTIGNNGGITTIVLESSGYTITARAPLPPDSLRVLLSELR